MFIFFSNIGWIFWKQQPVEENTSPPVGSSLLFLMHWDEFQEESEPPSYNSWIKSMIKSYKNPWPPWEITYQLGWLVVGVKVHQSTSLLELFHDSTNAPSDDGVPLEAGTEPPNIPHQKIRLWTFWKGDHWKNFLKKWRGIPRFPVSSIFKEGKLFQKCSRNHKKNWRSASVSPISFAALLGHSSYVREGAPIFQLIFLLNDTRVTVHLLTDKMEQSNSTWTCFRYATKTHSANGPWDKSLNFTFPSKHVIPESLKFSHWLSEKKNCKHAGKTFKNKKLQLQHKQLIGGLEISHC